MRGGPPMRGGPMRGMPFGGPGNNRGNRGGNFGPGNFPRGGMGGPGIIDFTNKYKQRTIQTVLDIGRHRFQQKIDHISKLTPIEELYRKSISETESIFSH